VGTLMLRLRNDESKKPFVTFTTEAVSLYVKDEEGEDMEC
jgi:hypothetical protein